VEDAYNAVTAPSSIVLYRTDILCDLFTEGDSTMRPRGDFPSGHMMEVDTDDWVFVKKLGTSIPMNKEDYYGKELKGFVERISMEHGVDRHLSLKMVEKGFHMKYEPRSVAYTQTVDTIGDILQQRKRHNNSQFFCNISMFFSWKFWKAIRTIPLIILSVFDNINFFFMPVNSILVLNIIWPDLIRYCNDSFSTEIDTQQLIFWWVILQCIVMVITKITTSDMFFALLTFFTGGVMIAAIFFFIDYVFVAVGKNFIANPATAWPSFVLLVIWPAMHLVLTIFNPFVFFMGICTYMLFPILTFTTPLYSFLSMDDLTWGTR